MPPSLLHESLVLLFRQRPTLAAELLRDALGLELPAYREARAESAELNQVVPTEYRADLVVKLIDGKPVLAIIVEAQLGTPEQKRFAWPAYGANLRASLECDCVVLVVTPDESVARWARQPIRLGGDSVFVPLVIGPSGIPVVTDPTAAAELALLSAMAHGKGEVPVAVRIAQAATGAISSVPEAELRRMYYDLLVVALSEAARKAFQMLPEGYVFQSEAARSWIAKGKVEGRAEDVLEILDARGIRLDDSQRTRVLECTDLDTLRLWIRRAVKLSRADELFEE